MTERDGPDSPWIQAGRLTFLALYAVTVLAALAWAFSNVRQIDPQNRAVVLHFGALDRIQNAGLLLAWPQPFEQVVLLPAADRVIERRVENLLRSDAATQADRVASFATPLSDALAGSGYLLTGDAGVVQLDVRVFYKVTEPYAFVLQGEHVLPALDRLVTRSAVALTAARDLDTILVARPELIGTDNGAAERRERLRADLVQGINKRLAELAATGLGLGIEVTRVDVQSSLPGPAVNAFNAVLTASQQADKRWPMRALKRKNSPRPPTRRLTAWCKWPTPRPVSAWPAPRRKPPPSPAWRRLKTLACCCAFTASACRTFLARPVQSLRSTLKTTPA